MTKVKFGTGGFRGIIGDDFNKENVQKICQAVCNIAIQKNYKKEICIGYDNRFSSEYFAEWCAEVFAGNGYFVEVINQSVTTPVVMFYSKIKKYKFGVMITASHNPYIYNGVKVFTNEGKDASIEETNEIEQEMELITTIKTADLKLYDKINRIDIIDDYLNYLVENQGLRNIGKGLKVVFDAKHGSSKIELEKLCNKLGIEDYDIINGDRDAFFGFQLPAPNENNLLQLKDAVVKQGYDIGFALDADGDRLAVVDENGNYIDNNYILAIMYYYFVKYEGKKGDSVKNCCTSSLLDIITNKLGYNCYEVPVGFKWVSGKLIEKSALIGGESSGGLAVDNHIWGKDSLLAIGLCIKAIIGMKKSFSLILEEVKEFANNYSKSMFDKAYTFDEKQKGDIKTKIFERNDYPVQTNQIQKIVKTDYLKIWLKNNSWVNIRFSGTEPVLRIFIECDNSKQANEMFKQWENYLNLAK